MINLSQLHLGCEYQPLIDSRTEQIYAYEALARFYNAEGLSTPPNLIFELLHHDAESLHRIELAAKQLQIAHAPQDLPLFINIDPHAIPPGKQSQLIEMLHQHKQITVEVIENTCVSEAECALTLAKRLQQAGIRVALDDVGATHAMLSLHLMSLVDCLKFDKGWLHQDSPAHPSLLTSLLQFSQSTQKLSVLEGVESKAHLTHARNIGVDLVQGFHYKSMFINPKTRIPLQPFLSKK